MKEFFRPMHKFIFRKCNRNFIMTKRKFDLLNKRSKIRQQRYKDYLENIYFVKKP